MKGSSKIVLAAGIGGGIITAIVVASVVAIAIVVTTSKIGFDAYKKHMGKMGTAQSNPMYQETKENINPYYVEK